MSYNVLIVDDSSIVRKVLIKTFGLSSIPVANFYEAQNGAEGLALLKEHWVDIVFLDVNMPVMNGLEFMQNLRGDPEYQSLPVVIVSTEGSHERISELESRGISAYLRKPVTPEQLVETIQSILGGPHGS